MEDHQDTDSETTRVSRKGLLELKAHCGDLSKVQEWVQGNARSIGDLHQVDTYFRVKHGRLKLRETAGRDLASLIFYLREDLPTSKKSQVLLLEVDNARELTEILGEALGILIVVEKRRAVYRWREVQIHLDEVKQLGTFLEFEKVTESPDEERVAEEEFEYLKAALGIEKTEMVAESYSDLLLARRSPVD